MRFYFSFHDGIRVLDNRGTPCETLNDARMHAGILATEIGRARPANRMHSEHVVVTDELGIEVYRTSIATE